MVCEYCRGVLHSKQPKKCKGGTWCDCAHRLPTEIIRQLKEEVK